MTDELGRPVNVALTAKDAMMLMAGLRRYLDYWQRHYADDAGESHTAREDQEVRRHVGELLWRLESACAPPGSRVQHSEDAVEPRP